MSMIACAECNREISSLARACPGCGAPVGKGHDSPQIVTIQKTSKKYKGAGALAFVAFWFGVVMIFAGAPRFAGFVIPVSIIVWIWAKMGAWWNNE